MGLISSYPGHQFHPHNVGEHTAPTDHTNTPRPRRRRRPARTHAYTHVPPPRQGRMTVDAVAPIGPAHARRRRLRNRPRARDLAGGVPAAGARTGRGGEHVGRGGDSGGGGDGGGGDGGDGAAEAFPPLLVRARRAVRWGRGLGSGVGPTDPPRSLVLPSPFAFAAVGLFSGVAGGRSAVGGWQEDEARWNSSVWPPSQR